MPERALRRDEAELLLAIMVQHKLHCARAGTVMTVEDDHGIVAYR